MKTILHKAESRGHVNHGWLDSFHTFSFGNYYNPERMNFGVLRVLNDDRVAPAKGFGTHPHENMEIISLPLEGDLMHKDSMGNTTIIKKGDIQVMSAGTGIYHSEYNKNENEEVKFLQIWLFPKKKNVSPRYDQLSIEGVAKKNSIYQILSPSSEDQGVWIHQDAWFSIGDFDANHSAEYHLKKDGNGVYLFVIEGSIEINGNELNRRDGIGISDFNSFLLRTISNAKFLIMDIPMNI